MSIPKDSGTAGTTAESVATERNEVDRPQDWDKAVSAAFLWLILDEVKASAEGAGVGERTMHRWVRSDWWGDACSEASARWFNHLKAEARRSLMRAVKEDGDLALRILERSDPNLAQKPQEHRVSMFGLVAQLDDHEIRRLEALPDEELAREMKRLGSGD